ncbi:hypothetical protein FRC11_009909 [Ceratobasidium sp. 423]|nr:hypothetical protein FRC11_009909 [Ceratobasidium sp. 423]
MPPITMYIPDSDEDEPTSQSTQSVGKKQKVAPPAKESAPKAKAAPKAKVSAQKRVPKPKNSRGLTDAALSIEECSSKNAASHLSTKEERKKENPRKELAASIRHIEKSKSAAYGTFELPVLKKPVVLGAPYQYHAFVCKTCGDVILWEIGEGSTSALLKHQNTCERKKAQRTLIKYGVTGRATPPTEYEVRKYVVLWGIGGMFHITLDMYQSPNGFDYLRIIVFHTAVKDNVISLEHFVLECLKMLRTLSASRSEFDITALLFIQKRAALENVPHTQQKADDDFGLSSDEEEDTSLHETIDDDEGIDHNAEDETGEDDGQAPSRTLDELDMSEDELDDIFVAPMVPGSKDEKELLGAKKGLYKIAWLSKRLHFSSNAFKADFQNICSDMALPTPWNVPHDV